MRKRIEVLERSFVRTANVPPHVVTIAERVGAAAGVDVAELLEEARAILAAAGPPYTTDRLVNYVARRRGIPVAALQADAERILEAMR